MRNIVSVIVVLFFSQVTVRSESVKWLIHPEYDRINYYSSDIFKCEKEGRISLIDWYGRPLVDQKYLIDSITAFTEGYALVLRQENQGYRIIGLLAEEPEHPFQVVDGEYYTSAYSFFSEGYLVVSNKKGKLGYLDVTGKCVIECDYLNARPFRMGFASVNRKSDEVLYINHQGKTKNPIGFYGGKIDKGSSFNDSGEAIVRHNKKECAIINSEMQVLRERPYEGVFPIRTYDYAYSEDYVNPAPIVNKEPVSDGRYRVFGDKNGIGYCDEHGSVVVPSQFNYGGPFCNGRSIVLIDNKYGVLQLVDGNFTSVCSAHDNRLIVYPGKKSKEIEYDLEVPQGFDKKSLILLLDKGDGNLEETRVPVKFQPVVDEDLCVFRVKVFSADGLLLWEEKKGLDITLVRLSVSSPTVTTPYAMENGIQQIKATITNQSVVEIEVISIFSISLDRNKKNSIQGGTASSTMKLEPGQRKDLVVNVKVKENETVNAKLSVTVDGYDCGFNTAQVQLKKI